MPVVSIQRIVCFLVVASVPVVAFPQQKKADPQDSYELMRTFVETFEQIERNYVQDIDREELMEAAIRGMLTRLDQYSSYIGPKELSNFNQSVDQEFGGIGIQVQINPDSKRLTVISPLPGTPAYRAGVRAGDTIMEISGESTEGYSLPDAVKKLKGRAGEAVTIGVLHEGGDKIEQVEIVRDIIQVDTVRGDHYNDEGRWDYFVDDQSKIGYVRLTHFSRRSAEELSEAVSSLSKGGMTGLILDLRYNPGGLLSQAVEVADMFIENGRIVSTNGRNTPERSWDARPHKTYSDFPMVILVNRFSASASEIVSACLQDHDRAVVVGERTWGKGSVQNVINLNKNQSALKLTTASYHRPSGKKIHRFPGEDEDAEWGVVPNDGYNVRLTFDEMRGYRDYRAERDTLRNGGPPESNYVDRQFAKAVDYINSKLDGSPESANVDGDSGTANVDTDSNAGT